MALNPLVSLFGRLVARSGRKRGNRRTDGQNDRPSICNPRCACASRVKNKNDYTSAMLSIFGRAGAILLAVVDVSHA